jgi:tetratricopeptide (TPR) repeat protein
MECLVAFLEAEMKDSWLVFNNTYHAFLVGLASFKAYRDTCDNSWLKRGRERMGQMKLWSEQGSPLNFSHKLYLLEAEEQYSVGNIDAARELYKRSIQYAGKSKYVNEEALACELAGRFYFNIGEVSVSLDHFILAHERYQAWGAIGKANQLFGFISSSFARHSGNPHPSDPGHA